MKKTIIATLALATVMASPVLYAAGKADKAQGAHKIKTFGIIPKRIGGKWLQDNPKECFTCISQLGYSQVERNDNYGMSPQECRKFLDGLHLKTVIWGVATNDVIDAIDGKYDGLDKSIAECKTAGAKYLACYSTTKKYNATIDGWKEWAAALNKVGEYCAKKGIKLLYHNHAIEFTPIGGVVPYDVLVPALNPRFCNMEFDIYWAAKGDADPLAVMKKFPGRFPVIHMKDMSSGQDRNFEDLGYGILDYPAIFRQCGKAGVRYYIVEHDKPTDSKRSIERGAEFFKKTTY
ncbi:hypothetical protein FACS1894159_01400 [Bacteroidia bacterium]|nr:hypothetical protein FACS1894159_01400 [Bacteroidia bacterium]